jgi:cytochrome c oxidase cbb3-type subunit 3
MADNQVPERDHVTGTETTQHEWDGITELNTPLPRWWLWTFYGTVIWSVFYIVAWPYITSSPTGFFGSVSTRATVAEKIEENAAQNADIAARVAASDFQQIAADPALDEFARLGGAALYRTYCSQCHGAGAAGAKGYPNLLDDEWLWGGSHEAIYLTLKHGIRWEADPDTRYSEMPAFGDMGILTHAQIASVADYVLSLTGDAAATPEGEQLYADNCAACHGENALGDTELGAPNLADAIWLYGGDRETVIATITHSRFGVMPSWSERLDETEIKQLTHYVHSLGGGE